MEPKDVQKRLTVIKGAATERAKNIAIGILPPDDEEIPLIADEEPIEEGATIIEE